MPDAQTAADASAPPHAAPPPSEIPAMAGDVAALNGDPAPTKPATLFHAATGLLPVLEAGRALDAATLRRAMSAAFGATDTQGAWVWKDAYEAAEAALVLFLQRYARLMRRQAGAGPSGPAAMLAMLETLAALEPSQTRRSEEQLELQQFSTPLPLAYAALQAAAVRPGDTVLEPSAGTGMLAVMAECALGDRTAGALHLNELAGVRAGLLTRLFPDAPVTRHNAESIADRLPAIAPSVVLMNPPFSVSPGVNRIRHDADLRHLRSAFSMLPVGGRLAAITSANCIPSDAAWADVFEHLDPRVVFSIAIDGRAYARRGTTFDTRLTILDKGGKDGGSIAIDGQSRVIDAAGLLAAVAGQVPPRLPVEVTADLFGHRPAPRPTTSKRGSKVAAKPEPQESRQMDWGPVSELSYRIVATNVDAATSEPVNLDAGLYDPWAPRTVRIEGASAHPTPLVQSAAMAAVSHPVPDYRPMLPGRIAADGMLSDAQLESVILAGQAHGSRLDALYRIAHDWETVERADNGDEDNRDDETTGADPGDGNPYDDGAADGIETFSEPVRFRRGWMLGDGTGCGKGRQVAAVILDNRLKGRVRSLWLSQSDKLLEDARRDWAALGGSDDDVIPLGKFRQGAEIPHESGILFATYATLRSPARQGRASRLDQVVAWLAGGLDEDARHAFGGVIVFDEAHAMANAAGAKGSRGQVAPSQQGRAGLRLQHALPDARIMYVSATGATTVPGLAYAQRLGLWGSGETPFEQRTDFVVAMEAGGVAAMEVVARDLKALGLYQARALSYDGVEVDILEHPLSPEQRRIYDSYAEAFKVIHSHLEMALKATGIVQDGNTLNRNAKSAALSAFEGAKQRFFGHLLTSMKCPSLIRAVEADLDAGRAAVVQLVSTNEALMERRIAEIPASEWDDLSIDLTPRELVLDYLAHAFPVQLQEAFTDEEGNLMSRPVFDGDGNPVICQEALAARDELIGKLASLPPVPAALDQILHRFGHGAVAEVTGRSRRVLKLTDGGTERLALRPRPASANLAETAAFMEGTKKILVFSMAGGTGRSYHADLGCGNTARRVHYLLEPGWRADQAIQGSGPHPSNAPGLGAAVPPADHRCEGRAPLHRHHRAPPRYAGRHHPGAAGLPVRHGRGQRHVPARGQSGEPLRQGGASPPLHRALARQHRGWSLERFETATGLSLTYEGGLKEDLPPMPKFLNRLLALPIAEQNALFAALEERIAALVAEAMESGSYDRGVETVHADSLVLASREPVFTHEATGAVTELCEIQRRDKLEPLTAEAALSLRGEASGAGRETRLMTNERSRRAALVLPHASRMLEDGGVEERVRLVRPAVRETMAGAELDASTWREADEEQWRALWEAEIGGLPSHTESRFWLVTGLLLPIWDRVPDRNMRVRRLTADSGEHMIGRVLGPAEAVEFRNALGLAGGPGLTPAELFGEIMDRGAAFPLATGGSRAWRLARRSLMGAPRLEIEGPADGDVGTLKRMGCATEIVSWRTRVFVPDADVLERVVARYPLAQPV